MAGRATKRGGGGRGVPAKRGRSSSVGKKSSTGGDNDSDAKKLEETVVSTSIAKSKGATIDKVTYPRHHYHYSVLIHLLKMVMINKR